MWIAMQPEIFLRKASLVNHYYDELSQLYQQHRAHRIDAPSALSRKAQLFARLRSECAAISPDPRSFNKCLAVDNNAGLAFDRTYTKYYPLVYDLFQSQHHDLKSTIEALNGLRNLSEAQAAGKIRDTISAARN